MVITIKTKKRKDVFKLKQNLVSQDLYMGFGPFSLTLRLFSVSANQSVDTVGCTRRLSTAHTTSVENGQCVLRLILYTVTQKTNTVSYFKSQHFYIHLSFVSFFSFDMRLAGVLHLE